MAAVPTHIPVDAKLPKEVQDLVVDINDAIARLFKLVNDLRDSNLTDEIGTSVQAWSGNLDDIAALTPTDGNVIVGDGTDWVAESGATARTSLGVAIGTDVQAWDSALDDISGLALTDGGIIVGDGSNFVLETGATARTSLGAAASGDVTASGLTVATDRLLGRDTAGTGAIEEIPLQTNLTFSSGYLDLASQISVTVYNVQSYIQFQEQSSDPGDPPEGQARMWQSDGTGAGDDGDIMIKITAGATTKTVTLVDFSAF